MFYYQCRIAITYGNRKKCVGRASELWKLFMTCDVRNFSRCFCCLFVCYCTCMQMHDLEAMLRGHISEATTFKAIFVMELFKIYELE